jgi:hypothetical protein
MLDVELGYLASAWLTLEELDKHKLLELFAVVMRDRWSRATTSFSLTIEFSQRLLLLEAIVDRVGSSNEHVKGVLKFLLLLKASHQLVPAWDGTQVVQLFSVMLFIFAFDLHRFNLNLLTLPKSAIVLAHRQYLVLA